jgi:hypothetical protein
MIFSNNQTTNQALLTLDESRRQRGCDSMRSRSIAAPVNLSTIGRSPPPRDWTPRSLSSSLHPEATGPFEPLLLGRPMLIRALKLAFALAAITLFSAQAACWVCLYHGW